MTVSAVTSNPAFVSALRAAIDNAGIAKLFGKDATAAAGLVPPAFAGALPQSDAPKRDLAKAEQRTAELEARRADLEARLSMPLPPKEIGELGLELQAVNDALAECEEAWLLLSEQIEAES